MNMWLSKGDVNCNPSARDPLLKCRTLVGVAASGHDGVCQELVGQWADKFLRCILQQEGTFLVHLVHLRLCLIERQALQPGCQASGRGAGDSWLGLELVFPLISLPRSTLCLTTT